MTHSKKSNVCEEKTFETIYNKHATDLYNFLYYKYGEQLDPSDKVQNAFIKLWEKCSDIVPEKAKSFLFTVANNLSINAFKHQKVILNYESNHLSDTKNSQDPSFIMEEKEYLKKFQKALSKLSPEKRATFLMCKAEGKKHQEVADLFGVSRKTIEKRLYTAIDELRIYIKEI